MCAIGIPASGITAAGITVFGADDRFWIATDARAANGAGVLAKVPRTGSKPPRQRS
ncbi:hypothetical protein MPLA_770088 [Mesorhizobium sp. ORS 3359]|nr:hypothetical protein MPLA_770088 [Mesorhizobium sp. ORS 3359]